MTNNTPRPGQCNVSPAPTAWDRFLAGEGLSETTCCSLLKGKAQESNAVRSWVLQHYRTNYVPEAVLHTLGLLYHVNSMLLIEQ